MSQDMTSNFRNLWFLKPAFKLIDSKSFSAYNNQYENLKDILRHPKDRGSASGTESPESRGLGPGNLRRGPGLELIIKFGTQIQDLRDSGPVPGMKSEKSGTRD